MASAAVHQAFDGILNGGICGALLDCHSNWAAAIHLMKKSGASSPPCCVTADFHVHLKRPTPMATPLHLRAHVVESSDDRAIVKPRSRRTEKSPPRAAAALWQSRKDIPRITGGSSQFAVRGWQSKTANRQLRSANYPFACSSNRISSIASAALSIGSTHVPAPRCPPPP